jgi:hypothetical protein
VKVPGHSFGFPTSPLGSDGDRKRIKRVLSGWAVKLYLGKRFGMAAMMRWAGMPPFLIQVL